MEGDTLIGIAYQYGITVDELRAANFIHDDRLLQIGQVLTIPDPVSDPLLQAVPTPLAHAIVQASAAVDSLRVAWIMGSVENLATVPVEQVRVVARLLTETEEEVARSRVLSLRHIVPPGETTPFMMQVRPGGEDWSQWELSVATSLPAYVGRYYLDLAVSDLRFRPFVGRAVTVEGQVENRGRDTVQDVEIIVTALNDVGQIIGIRVLQPEPPILTPGNIGEFEGPVFALGSDVASVEAFAQGITAE